MYKKKFQCSVDYYHTFIYVYKILNLIKIRANKRSIKVLREFFHEMLKLCIDLQYIQNNG